MSLILSRRKYVSSGFAFNNAIDIVNANEYISFNPYTTLGGGTSLATWFYINSSVSGRLVEGSSSFITLIDTTTIRIDHPTNSNFTVPTMSTGTWYHLVTTWNDPDNQTRVYFNGVESSTGSLGNTAAPLWDTIGRQSGTVDKRFDEFAIWDSLLTEANAASLYNSGAGADAASVVASPHVHFHLDETGTATTAVDSSGNGNNGTLNNFPSSGMWVAH